MKPCLLTIIFQTSVQELHETLVYVYAETLS